MRPLLVAAVLTLTACQHTDDNPGAQLCYGDRCEPAEVQVIQLHNREQIDVSAPGVSAHVYLDDECEGSSWVEVGGETIVPLLTQCDCGGCGLLMPIPHPVITVRW